MSASPTDKPSSGSTSPRTLWCRLKALPATAEASSWSSPSSLSNHSLRELSSSEDLSVGCQGVGVLHSCLPRFLVQGHASHQPAFVLSWALWSVTTTCCITALGIGLCWKESRDRTCFWRGRISFTTGGGLGVRKFGEGKVGVGNVGRWGKGEGGSWMEEWGKERARRERGQEEAPVQQHGNGKATAQAAAIQRDWCQAIGAANLTKVWIQMNVYEWGFRF